MVEPAFWGFSPHGILRIYRTPTRTSASPRIMPQGSFGVNFQPLDLLQVAG